LLLGRIADEDLRPTRRCGSSASEQPEDGGERNHDGIDDDLLALQLGHWCDENDHRDYTNYRRTGNSERGSVGKLASER
jgi:hypothetical protein